MTLRDELEEATEHNKRMKEIIAKHNEESVRQQDIIRELRSQVRHYEVAMGSSEQTTSIPTVRR